MDGYSWLRERPRRLVLDTRQWLHVSYAFADKAKQLGAPVNDELRKPIDLWVLSWIEAANSRQLLEYLVGDNVTALRSGEAAPTDRQTEVITTLSNLRQSTPKDLVEADTIEMVRGWLTQVGTDGKSLARSLHEHVIGIEESIDTQDNLEAAIVALALDSYAGFLLPPDLFPVKASLMAERASYHLTSQLYDHPHAREFADAVLSDPVLNTVFKQHEHIGWAVQVHQNTTPDNSNTIPLIILPELILSAAWRQIQNGAPTVGAFVQSTKEQLALVRDILAGKDRSIIVKLAFVGVLLPAGTRIDVPRGVVRPVSDSEYRLTPEFLKGQWSVNSAGTTTTINRGGDVLLEYSMPYKVRVAEKPFEVLHPWPKDMRQVAELEQTAMLLQLSLTLAVWHKSRVQIFPTWRYSDDPLTFGGGAIGWYDPRQATDLRPTVLTDDDVTEWGEWYKKLDTPHVARIDLALSRIVRALSERREPSDVLVDSVIAWENLFGTSQGEPTLRVTACLARLLEDSTDTRKTLITKLRKIYRLRSQVVHGSANLRPEDHAKCQEALDVAIQAVHVLTATRTDILKLPDGAARSEALLLES